MAKALPFKLNRSSLLLAVVAAAFAGEAAAAAGRVDFASGNATVSDAQGRQRALAKGADLDKGDTVRTGENGRAQIRFTDGAYVSLQPNTEFSIKDYNFQGKTDGSERGLFALARGAMRTVTGLIGRVNRNRYQVSTPTATIGIRGTGGLISIGPDGSTLVNGTSGIWTLTNPAGTIDVPAGTTGKAPSAPSQPPQQTTEKPSTGPTQPATTETPYTQAGNRTPTGTSTSVASPNPNPPLVSGPGYHVSYAYNTTAGSNRNDSGTLADATFDAAGQLTQFAATRSATFTGTHQEFGTAAGVIAWGRWIGPLTGVDAGALNISPNANQGYHYVVGTPATAMPTAGSATYTFLGATNPTGQSGTIAPGTFTGNFKVTSWTTGTITLDGIIAFPKSGFSYSFNGSGSFSPGTPKFSGSSSSFSVTGQPAATTAGYGCTMGCTVLVNGAFFGAGAAYAGYSYMVTGASTNSVVGAATFKQ